MVESAPPVTKRSCDASGEQDDEVRYFEAAVPNTEFIRFVAERQREYEQMYVENLSVQLKCPERYDGIFRNKLGATVRRKCGTSDSKSSPFKYNSEIIDTKVGNEKSIMMRIKKTVPANELSTLPCGTGYTNGLPDEGISEYPKPFSISISAGSNKMGSAKRKTLGVKRRLSNPGKAASAKVAKLDHTADMNGTLCSDYSVSTFYVSYESLLS